MKNPIPLLALTLLAACPAHAVEYPWLAPYGGMLFIFDPPQPVAFWMKNTLIPLEIRFYNADGQPVARHLATPCTHDPCAHYPAHGKVAYVLETRARYRLAPPRQPLYIYPY